MFVYMLLDLTAFCYFKEVTLNKINDLVNTFPLRVKDIVKMIFSEIRNILVIHLLIKKSKPFCALYRPEIILPNLLNMIYRLSPASKNI